MSTTNEPEKRRQLAAKWLGRAVLVISALLCAAITVCYTWRLDAWAAVTVFPFWVWPLAGIVLVAASRRQVARRLTLAVGIAWSIVLVAYADHPLKLLRLTSNRDERTLRLVSLNCAGSNECHHLATGSSRNGRRGTSPRL